MGVWGCRVTAEPFDFPAAYESKDAWVSTEASPRLDVNKPGTGKTPVCLLRVSGGHF